jgi:hypothetical protein
MSTKALRFSFALNLNHSEEMLMLAVVAFQQSQGDVYSHKSAISCAITVFGAISAVRVMLITFGPFRVLSF